MSPVGSTGPESNQIMFFKASSFLPKHQMLQNAFDIFHVEMAQWHIFKNFNFHNTLCKIVSNFWQHCTISTSHHLGISFYVNFLGHLGSNGFQLK